MRTNARNQIRPTDRITRRSVPRPSNWIAARTSRRLDHHRRPATRAGLAAAARSPAAVIKASDVIVAVAELIPPPPPGVRPPYPPMSSEAGLIAKPRSHQSRPREHDATETCPMAESCLPRRPLSCLIVTTTDRLGHASVALSWQTFGWMATGSQPCRAARISVHDSDRGPRVEQFTAPPASSLHQRPVDRRASGKLRDPKSPPGATLATSRRRRLMTSTVPSRRPQVSSNDGPCSRMTPAERGPIIWRIGDLIL